MDNISIRDGLLAALTERYEADPAHFVSLPRQIVDSSSARAVIADAHAEEDALAGRVVDVQSITSAQQAVPPLPGTSTALPPPPPPAGLAPPPPPPAPPRG